MKKHKKTLVAVGALLVIAAILHFVPFDSRSGYLDKGLANLCIGYGAPVNYTYRWITGGVNQWDHQMDYLKTSNPGCAQPAKIRLYIL